MGRDDWYRNTTWDEHIAAEFEQRLSRARATRPQYLRIQAACLLGSTESDDHDVTVRLLERVIDEHVGGDAFATTELAGAHTQLAEHLSATGRSEDAAEHFERALDIEAQGYFSFRCEVGLAELIVRRGWRDRFARVDELLDAVEARLPSDHVRIATVRARLAAHRGDTSSAAAWARRALLIHGDPGSQLPKHPGIAVPLLDAATISELTELVARD